MVDYYLDNLDRLQAKPKKTIAEYVKRNGILVPKIFDSLSEAKSSGIDFIARSEHTQEYNGVSGLLKSYYKEEIIGLESEDEIKDVKLKSREGIGRIEQYCNLLQIDKNKFKKEISFSYWEKIKGYNRTVVADSSIKNKYHLITSTWKNNGWFANYTILEEGNISAQYIEPLNEDLVKGLENLVNFYEEIRSLPNFDPNHCPIMEIQTSGGKNYFLQYHRTRDFSESLFKLDRPVKNSEIEADLVRGASKPGEFIVDVTVVHAARMKRDFKEIKLPHNEEGSFDFEAWHTFSELMFRKRKLQITENNLKKTLLGLVVGHTQRSKLFKPEISIITNHSFFETREYESLVKRAVTTGEDQKIKLYVISDGRKAYLERIE